MVLLERIKLAANQRDVSNRSLIKLWLAAKVKGARDRAGGDGVSLGLVDSDRSIRSLDPVNVS